MKERVDARRRFSYVWSGVWICDEERFCDDRWRACYVLGLRWNKVGNLVESYAVFIHLVRSNGLCRAIHCLLE